MPGRKKCIVAKLFRDTTSTGKTPVVQCVFCEEIVIKNGSRMTKHIAKCLKCDESVKLKYLASGKSDDVQQELLACRSQRKVTDFVYKPSSASTSAQSSSPPKKRFREVTPSSLLHPKTPSFCASQNNKMNRYVDSMNEGQIVSNYLRLVYFLHEYSQYST